ncbi:phage tail P2-like protein [Pseudomonas helmanticensis]|uniref:Phage tail P2-like protein n=1 Tax=Pseudomonas helmanticensis TaxID=1471381 RepID=A0A4R7V0V9_9PSED|nr:phage tail protein I [Pseudomonas helmanticensis]TDV42879.1 phage tail P2-like protein [Pseudomonas helmanticensis]
MANHPLTPALAGDERFSLLCELLDQSLAALDTNAVLVYLIDLTKPHLLPHLADQFSLLDEAAWQLAESEQAKRNLIKNAVELHRFKGTPWAIREVIRLLGFGEVTLQEGPETGPDTKATGKPVWPLYRVIFKRLITNDQAVLLRRLLLSVAPARCRLVSLDYQTVAIRYNAVASYDGQYNHGSS